MEDVFVVEDVGHCATLSREALNTGVSPVLLAMVTGAEDGPQVKVPRNVSDSSAFGCSAQCTHYFSDR